MKLVSVSYAQSRLNFFRDQLAAANRRLDWSMKHNPDWYDHSEKGEVVSFYEWAVRIAEKEADVVISDIKGMKAADVAQVVHGRWERYGKNLGECLECGEIVSVRSNYCPNCGAKMDGGDSDEAD